MHTIDMGRVGVPLYTRMTDAEAVRVHQGSFEVDVVDLLAVLRVVHAVQPARRCEHILMRARTNL